MQGEEGGGGCSIGPSCTCSNFERRRAVPFWHLDAEASGG